MADNGKIIWDNLIKLGYSEIGAAGIMGNLMAESSLNPKIVQGGGEADNITCDGETGYGLAQWTSLNRQENLAAFASGKGRPSGDLYVQIDFLDLEIQQYGLKEKVSQQSSPSEAAYIFHNEFEKSADTPEQMQRRAVYAEQIYASKGEGCSNLTYDGDGSTYSFGGVLAGTVANALCAANSAPRSSKVPHGKHADTLFKNPSKTYCEPVYPDLVSLNNKIPEALTQDIFSKCKEKELIPGANMVYSMPTNVLIKYGGEDYANAQAMNTQLEQQRKETFDPKKNVNSFKMPSVGKPPNNDDPFPFDAKIEELETHSPRCKIEQIQTCPEAVNVARACMQLSTNVEKRIVKLENNMATLMRYLARMSSRFCVNCVYWGGTNNAEEKYLTIRCMKDNRIDDGQYVSIDQCLTCTRYEPLIGQTYDILNDEGINLAQVLDDCQMSYTTMEEYCKFIQPTQHQSSLNTVSLKFSDREKRDANEKDFTDEWSSGLKMDWTLYPVEDQKPHINKFQNINGDEFKRLKSYPGTATNFGAMYTGGLDNRIVANKKLMDNIISQQQ